MIHCLINCILSTKVRMFIESQFKKINRIKVQVRVWSKKLCICGCFIWFQRLEPCTFEILEISAEINFMRNGFTRMVKNSCPSGISLKYFNEIIHSIFIWLKDAFLLKYGIQRKLFEYNLARQNKTILDVLESWAKVQPNTNFLIQDNNIITYKGIFILYSSILITTDNE